jgi:DNA (cytosine-5)-methyltransferase 1
MVSLQSEAHDSGCGGVFRVILRVPMTRRTVISLFSGAGGLDYGFEAAGFQTRVAVDVDRDACASLRESRRWRVMETDIADVSSADILDAARLRRADVDVLIGGPPCQPFSKSGFWSTYGTHRLADPRAKGLGAFMRVVEEMQPSVFLLENVQGIKFAEFDEGFALLMRAIKRINNRTGSKYRSHCAVLNAADYGVPQLRERLFLVAARDGRDFRFPTATHGDGPNLLKMRTAWDALADVAPSPDEDLAPRGKWSGLLPSIPEGMNYLFHTSRGAGEPIFGWRCRYWTFLLKLAKDRPSWTIQANPGPSCGPFHWKNRRLSLRELCRLQTFPDDALVTGSAYRQRRQVGNAVPSLLAEVLAREIAVQLLGARKYQEPPTLMPPDRGRPPGRERRLPVAQKFRKEIGNHADHPGEGRGKGAIARDAA